MEMRRKSKLASYLIISLWAILTLSAVSWVLVGSVAWWVKNDWLPKDSSGWAQAIGSLLAVLVAVGAPIYQNHHQRKTREEEYTSKKTDGIYATLALAEHVKELLERMSELFGITASLSPDFNKKLKIIQNDTVSAAAMIREIPITSLTVLMVRYVLRLRELASFAETSSNNVPSNAGWSTWDKATQVDVRTAIKELSNIIEELEGMLD